jgi:DNA-binding transcriptional regulator of glucitol operon
MTNPSYRDPSKEYPPTRPTWRMMLAALVVVAAAAAFLNWPQVSAFAHVSQIETELAHVL